MDSFTRRRFVKGALTASVVGIAGCVSDDSGDNDTDQDDMGLDGANDTGGVDGTDGNETDGTADDGTDGDSNATDGDGNATDSDGNATDGDGNATDGDGNATDGAPSVEDYPAVDRWLTESEVGGVDESYDGTIEDARDTDTVTVDVGAQGGGGAFAFDPSAVAVSAGTTVEWNWTGEGNPHNVEASPDEQIGESDYEFSSGDAVGGSGVQFTQTLDQAGIALYYCRPHLSLGMKGAIVVVE